MNPRTVHVAGFLLLGVLACGCGKATGTLEGSVSLNGEPLKGGQVSAYDAENTLLGQATVVDGSYRMTDLPPGPVTLVVQTHLPDGQPINGTAVAPPAQDAPPPPPDLAKELKKGMPQEAVEAARAIKPVPSKYTSTRQSDLKTTVEGGTTKYNIEMTGKGEMPRPMPPPGRNGQPPPPHGHPLPPHLQPR